MMKKLLIVFTCLLKISLWGSDYLYLSEMGVAAPKDPPLEAQIVRQIQNGGHLWTFEKEDRSGLFMAALFRRQDRLQRYVHTLTFIDSLTNASKASLWSRSRISLKDAHVFFHKQTKSMGLFIQIYEVPLASVQEFENKLPMHLSSIIGCYKRECQNKIQYLLFTKENSTLEGGAMKSSSSVIFRPELSHPASLMKKFRTSSSLQPTQMLPRT